MQSTVVSIVTLVAIVDVPVHVDDVVPAVRHSVLDAFKQLCVIELIRAGFIGAKHKTKSLKTTLVNQVLHNGQACTIEGNLK